MKRDAALDTSFWINAYRAELYQYLPRYFDLAYCSKVKEEIEVADPNQPLIIYPDTQAFRVFCQGGFMAQRDPKSYAKVFGEGESQALALAQQDGRLLLIDDLAPYRHAINTMGLQALDTAAFTLQLYADKIVSLKGALNRLARLAGSLSKDLLEPARLTIEILAAGRKEKTT